MTIAIDFDGTWSRAPVLFIDFAEAAKRHGHEVIIVTRRQPEHKVGAEGWLRVIYCTGEFKRIHCEKLGIKVDIWIDDEPGTIEPQRLLNSSPDISL